MKVRGDRSLVSGIKVWAWILRRIGGSVDVRKAKAKDGYLDAVAGTLSEWDSPEDEAAYRDL